MSGNKENKIIVRVDGGICSQIEFVALGLFLQKNYGECVSFDLSWFDEYGKDMNGVFDRNWDMLKAFPSLSLNVASEDEIKTLKCSGEKCANTENCIKILERGVKRLYIYGYPDRTKALMQMLDVFRRNFYPTMSDDCIKLERDIKACESCAVHVRRGDLSVTSEIYGKPTSIEYFKYAMFLIKGFAPDTKFFIFSDEPDWCESNILPFCFGRGVVCRLNGSDKGYLDLYLMSKCKRIISSHGSLGKMAALLSEVNDFLVLSRRDDFFFRTNLHVCYLNDDWDFEYPSERKPVDKVIIRKDGWRKPFYKIYKHLRKILIDER